MNDRKTILLSKPDIEQLLGLNEAIKSVEDVFCAYNQGRIELPPIVHADVADGEFHIKAGGYKEGLHPYFTTKINGGFFSNGAKHNLPSILGLIVLNDTRNGYPLAVMESSTITSMRTAAAMAVAAKHLANPDATTATLCGCGKQASWQLRALKEVFPLLTTIFVYSSTFEKSAQFCDIMAQELRMDIIPVKDLEKALQTSTICITCTSSKKDFLKKWMVPPGMFIAAMGADSPDKQEIDPLLFKEAKIVVDIREQCAAVGELHHALKLKLVDLNKEIVDLGQVVSGKSLVREKSDDIIIFDSTGTAMQDTALAGLVYEKAIRYNKGQYFPFL